MSISEVMAQSEVMKQSMVPMLGQIMPAPLQMAPRRTILPPMVVSTAISFMTVSVVMMASAADWEPPMLRAEARAGTLSWMALMFSSTPMTPVEATAKSSA